MKKLDKLISAATHATLRENDRLKQVVSRIVPATSFAHIQFCRLEEGRLRVTVDSAAWVARLRFSERQLIDELKTHNLAVVSISWHVAASETPRPRTTKREAHPLTKRSADAIKAVAEITRADADGGEVNPDSDKLRQELLKLAARLRQ